MISWENIQTTCIRKRGNKYNRERMPSNKFEQCQQSRKEKYYSRQLKKNKELINKKENICAK